MKMTQGLISLGGAALVSWNIEQCMKPPKMFLGWLFGGESSSKTSELKSEVYAWGNGVRTERSEYLSSYPLFEPTKVASFDGKNNPCMKEIIFGKGTEGGIDFEGNLYVWPGVKQLSLIAVPEGAETQPVNEFASRTKIHKLASNVQKGGLVGNSAFALLKDGTVKKISLNIEAKRDNQAIFKDKLIHSEETFPLVKDIVDMSFGEDHILLLDKNGNVFAMGDDTLGQCGTGTNGRTTFGPWAEKTLTKFEQIKGN